MINSDDNNRDGIDPLLITTIPEDGNYCLEVNTFGFETGPFSISMVEGSVFCPGAGQINLNDTVTGSVADGRRTCYQVNGVAGTAYTFTVNSPTDTDTVLELYDATGVMLDSDDDSAGYPNPMLSFTPSDAGTYYIIIRGYGTGSAGEYEMTLSEGPRGCSDAATDPAGRHCQWYRASGPGNLLRLRWHGGCDRSIRCRLLCRYGLGFV